MDTNTEHKAKEAEAEAVLDTNAEPKAKEADAEAPANPPQTELAADPIPQQQYVTTQFFCSKFDALAGMVQTLISKQDEDRRIQAAHRQEDRDQCKRDSQRAATQREQDRELLATKADVLSILNKKTDDWMASQNRKINDALEAADTTTTKIFMDGLAALTEQIRDDITSKFARATAEHEETMRKQIKKYEEQYSRLAKDASQYQQLKAKWEEVEQKAIATQNSVENMVARATANASDPTTMDNTAYTKEIIQNRDHVDDRVKQFLKDLTEKESNIERKLTKMNEAKEQISTLYAKLKE